MNGPERLAILEDSEGGSGSVFCEGHAVALEDAIPTAAAATPINVDNPEDHS
jgi:hypothetical protein